jgi:hypothetical protein
MTFATTAPATHLHRQVSRGIPPAQPAESRVGEGDHRVEVTAGDRPEHQDDREQPGRRRSRVLQQLQARITRRQLLGGDARADHQRGKQ